MPLDKPHGVCVTAYLHSDLHYWDHIWSLVHHLQPNQYSTAYTSLFIMHTVLNVKLYKTQLKNH